MPCITSFEPWNRSHFHPHAAIYRLWDLWCTAYQTIQSGDPTLGPLFVFASFGVLALLMFSILLSIVLNCYQKVQQDQALVKSDSLIKSTAIWLVRTLYLIPCRWAKDYMQGSATIVSVSRTLLCWSVGCARLSTFCTLPRRARSTPHRFCDVYTWQCYPNVLKLCATCGPSHTNSPLLRPAKCSSRTTFRSSRSLPSWRRPAGTVRLSSTFCVLLALCVGCVSRRRFVLGLILCRSQHPPSPRGRCPRRVPRLSVPYVQI